MKIIGHKGAAGLKTENTIESFKEALRLGVDMLEFDLRVTNDQVVILHHDSTIVGKDGSKYKINENDYSKLHEVCANLATFKELLDTCGEKVPLYVEVKPKENITPIIQIIRTYIDNGWSPGHFFLGSFSQRTLVELHKELPECPTIVIEKWSGLRAVFRARRVNAKIICMHHSSLWSGYIRAASKSGFELYTFTLNNPEKAKKWAQYGLKGVVTDYPDRFKQ